METWGDLPKSQIDNSTVDEEIDALIQAHKDDPDSHLEAGQSLQSHKASEIIDHIARSVVRDKLCFDRFQIDEHFSSIDAWESSAGVALDTLAQCSLTTLAVTNNIQYLYALPADSMQDGAKPQNNPVWQARIKCENSTAQEIYFGQFDLDVPSGVGFKIVNASLYAFYIDNAGAEHLTAIAGITVNGEWHNYRYNITAGYNILFYVDDILKVTLNTITLTTVQMFAYFRIKTTANSEKIIYIQQFHFDEDFTV